MIRKLLLGAIPTLVAGIAMMTLSGRQQCGVALDHVKTTAVKNSGHSVAKKTMPGGGKADKMRYNSQNATSKSSHDPEFGSYRGYRGYHGYRGYRGYRGYYGYGHYYGYRGYYATGSQEGEDSDSEE